MSYCWIPRNYNIGFPVSLAFGFKHLLSLYTVVFVLYQSSLYCFSWSQSGCAKDAHFSLAQCIFLIATSLPDPEYFNVCWIFFSHMMKFLRFVNIKVNNHISLSNCRLKIDLCAWKRRGLIMSPACENLCIWAWGFTGSDVITTGVAPARRPRQESLSQILCLLLSLPIWHHWPVERYALYYLHSVFVSKPK